MRVSVVLPAYNEAENISVTVGECLTALGELGIEGEVVVVNDGSRDATGEIVRSLGARDARVRLVEHERNRGYGAACWSGMLAAREQLVFLMDSDRQFAPRELRAFFPHVEKADLVIGYRAHRVDPPHRVLYARVWGIGARILFGYVARDIDCAFKLFRREIVDVVRPSSRGATFTLEFLVRCRRAGYRFVELPVTHYPRPAGVQTGGNFRVIWRAVRELVRLRIALWRSPQRHKAP